MSAAPTALQALKSARRVRHDLLHLADRDENGFPIHTDAWVLQLIFWQVLSRQENTDLSTGMSPRRVRPAIYTGHFSATWELSRKIMNLIWRIHGSSKSSLIPISAMRSGYGNMAVWLQHKRQAERGCHLQSICPRNDGKMMRSCPRDCVKLYYLRSLLPARALGLRIGRSYLSFLALVLLQSYESPSVSVRIYLPV